MSGGKIALYVAEKPSVAKSITELLCSGGRVNKVRAQKHFHFSKLSFAIVFWQIEV